MNHQSIPNNPPNFSGYNHYSSFSNQPPRFSLPSAPFFSGDSQRDAYLNDVAKKLSEGPQPPKYMDPYWQKKSFPEDPHFFSKNDFSFPGNFSSGQKHLSNPTLGRYAQNKLPDANSAQIPESYNSSLSPLASEESKRVIHFSQDPKAKRYADFKALQSSYQKIISERNPFKYHNDQLAFSHIFFSSFESEMSKMRDRVILEMLTPPPLDFLPKDIDHPQSYSLISEKQRNIVWLDPKSDLNDQLSSSFSPAHSQLYARTLERKSPYFFSKNDFSFPRNFSSGQKNLSNPALESYPQNKLPSTNSSQIPESYNSSLSLLASEGRKRVIHFSQDPKAKRYADFKALQSSYQRILSERQFFKYHNDRLAFSRISFSSFKSDMSKMRDRLTLEMLRRPPIAPPSLDFLLKDIDHPPSYSSIFEKQRNNMWLDSKSNWNDQLSSSFWPPHSQLYARTLERKSPFSLWSLIENLLFFLILIVFLEREVMNG